MGNFNPTNSLVSSAFLYSYTAGNNNPIISAYGTLGVNCNNAMINFLSGNGVTGTFTASAALNVYLGQTVTGTVTGLSAIQPPLITFLSNNGIVSTQGYISSSTLNPVNSTAVFTINFNALAFQQTTFALSGNKSTIIDNGSVIDNPFYQNNDMTLFTGVIPTGPLGAPGLSSTNLAFRTVAQHARRIGQENQ